jgi:hypothetical protein
MSTVAMPPTLEVMEQLKDYIATKTQEITDNADIEDSSKGSALLDAFEKFQDDHELVNNTFLENMRRAGERGLNDADVTSVRIGRHIVSYIPIEPMSRRLMEGWALDKEIIETKKRKAEQDPGSAQKKRKPEPQ